MATDYKVTDTELTAVANAIRTKGGTSLPLEWPTGYVNAVDAIPSGGGYPRTEVVAVFDISTINYTATAEEVTS